LRFALRVIIAVSLLLQGGFGASFAQAAVGHDCGMSGHHHGQAPKCPCCPAKSLGDCADMCVTVATLHDAAPTFVVAPALPSSPIERPRFVAASIDTPFRPPIV
jgi:hypothetical protein